ncbi:MAG: CHASE3 domain-containing protein [Abitibacteriaceae bacterium]|nr:CHASE3 domain-containing protein [Abditibacteriaceae bacterium]
MNWSFQNRVASWFTAAALILAVVGAVSYRSLTSLIDEMQWVTHTHQVLERLDATLSAVTKAESSQRGYLLTGDKTYLDDYHESLDEVHTALFQVQAITSDNPQQQLNLNYLESSIAARTEQLQHRVDLLQNKGLAAAQQAMVANNGRANMQAVRSDIARMERIEQGLLEQRKQKVQHSARRAILTAFTGIGLSFLILAIVYRLMNREIKQRQQAEQSLQQQSEQVRLLRDIAIASNQATTIEEALQIGLDRMCQYLKWPLGHAYLVDTNGKELLSTKLWHLETPTHFDSFRKITEEQPIPVGKGLPGQVLATTNAVWISDVLQDTNSVKFLRAHIAPEAGIRAGFAFPILVGTQGVGVLEFFSMEPVEPDEDLLAILVPIGSQLGRVVERVRAEAALRQSEERFRSVTESANEAIISADSQSRIIAWNKGAENIFGYTADEILGQSLTKLMPERYHAAHCAGVTRFQATGEARVIGTTVELEGLRKDGNEFPLQLSVSTWQVNGESFYSGIISDITTRKQAAEALERQAQELVRSNTELEQFAYVASHDLQEPLRMVGSYTQLLSKRYKGKLDADADEFINYAVDGATRMQRLINDLLAYSRVGTKGKELKPTDCQAVLNRAINNLQGAIADNGATVTHESLPTVMGDEVQLGQLFQNLIGNAIKFHGEAPPEVHIQARIDENDAEKWLFTVRDNGIGIDPQYGERIFVIFQRLHSKTDYPGTGIGLAICKKIVERHGGSIWIESTVGQGTTFFFTLLAAPTPAESDIMDADKRQPSTEPLARGII